LWWSLGIIVVLSLVGFGHLLTPGQVPYNRYSDFIAQHLTTKTVLYDSLRQGRGIPFWRNDQFSGYPGLTNAQTMYTYPLHFLFYLLPPVQALGGTDYLHFLVAGLAFYALGSVLELGRWPRLFMAVAGMFNFKLIIASFAGWTPVVPIIVWLPGLLAAVLYAVKKPGPAAAVALALVGGLCFHCGQIQLFYYFVWFAAAYVLVFLIRLARRRQWIELRRTVLWLAVGGVLAVGLAAYLVVPLVESSRYSTRAIRSYRFFQASRSMKQEHLWTFLYPEALGTPRNDSYPALELWEDVGYFGIIPLLLAGAAMLWGRRRPKVWFFVICFILSVVLAFDTPLLRVVYWIVPGFSLFRISQRYFFLSAMFGICLGGMGLEELMARKRQGGQGFRREVVIAITAIALVAAEGTYYAKRYLTMAPYATVMPPPEVREFFAADPSLYRVVSLDRPTLNFGWSASLGIQSISGYDSFNYRHYLAYFLIMGTGEVYLPGPTAWLYLREIARMDLLDALNVKYLVSPAPLTFPGGELEYVTTLKNVRLFYFYRGFRQGDLYIYRNTRFLSRAFWASKLVEAGDEMEMSAGVCFSDPRESAVVPRAAGGAIANDVSPDDSVEMTSWIPGHLTIRTHNAQQRFLVVSEIWDPGWRSQIDGRQVPLYQTNITMLGLAVPAGDHEVTLEYRPPYWDLALGTTIASGAVLLLVAGLAVARRAASRRAAAG
jgi:hypothetical protein